MFKYSIHEYYFCVKTKMVVPLGFEPRLSPL